MKNIKEAFTISFFAFVWILHWQLLYFITANLITYDPFRSIFSGTIAAILTLVMCGCYFFGLEGDK